MSYRTSIWMCALLTLAIVLPRSLLINHAHSPCIDDDHHLDQGLSYLRGEAHPLAYYDPPLGKMILALPLHVVGAQVLETWYSEDGATYKPRRTVLYDQPLSLETLRLIQAAWKSLLFLPGILVVFAWCRRIYGERAAWLAVGLFLVDPTIAAHIPVAALDVLAMEAVLIASFCAWRYIERPTAPRLIAAGAATAAAMLIKHTAFLLPAAFVVLALLMWFVRPWWLGTRWELLRQEIRPRFNALAAVAMIVLVSIWALTLFDVSSPNDHRKLSGIAYADGVSIAGHLLLPAFEVRWPAGVYIGSVTGAFEHAADGQSAYLWGEIRDFGWWYYFPAVALHKVPLGIGWVGLLALISIVTVKPKWEEWSIIIPLLACGALIINSGINVGFRHALPTYGLALLLISRCAASPRKLWSLLAWLGVATSLVQTLPYHPNYIAFTNGLTPRPHLAISDSNLDWGQGMKQVRQWLDRNPQPGRAVCIDPFNEVGDPAMEYYFGGRIRRLYSIDPVPTSGILILNPARIVGVYHFNDKYARFREIDPHDVIGHCMLVYDLDKLRASPGEHRAGALKPTPTMR